MAAHGSISQVRLHCGRARGTSVQPRGYRLWKPFRKLRVLAWFDMKLIDHRYDALVVGARLMADVGLAQSGLETAGISKLQYIRKEAPQVVVELERYGMPFSRTAEDKLYQARSLQRPIRKQFLKYSKGGQAMQCFILYVDRP
ncbi:hypothetical protein I7I51_07735 [Histoplasma capsulatum]|uniref:Uncharacterized protein n=1 Tax=Ajellomyces capsulatus TaxID=5037 RepID=A0A8A1M1K2_AJECA|nr:predicted protein [Histoplasma mississippiense (nom. inval.)]EDN02729.1 predicted protein [Histoplasma mississippiense (nom. inval.)]QSS58312.1 hypothetical protein I7I51_07735 [Histoplasma capsulatum]